MPNDKPQATNQREIIKKQVRTIYQHVAQPLVFMICMRISLEDARVTTLITADQDPQPALHGFADAALPALVQGIALRNSNPGPSSCQAEEDMPGGDVARFGTTTPPHF
mmetsp:Transcript_7173/g.10284  ORF Transcript_7173/g.10284 Transcript_7173/m.10284 type:complete len:109 (+) Transcript_7173:321-647(+)